MALLGPLLSGGSFSIFGVRSAIKDTLLGRPFKRVLDNILDDSSGVQKTWFTGSAVVKIKELINERFFVTRFGEQTSPDNMARALCDAVEELMHYQPASEHVLRKAVKRVANSTEFHSPRWGVGVNLPFFQSRETKRLVDRAVSDVAHLL